MHGHGNVGPEHIAIGVGPSAVVGTGARERPPAWGWARPPTRSQGTPASVGSGALADAEPGHDCRRGVESIRQSGTGRLGKKMSIETK